MRFFLTFVLFLASCVSVCEAASSQVPEPFRGYDENSKYTINFDDLSNILRTAVVDVGMSTREKAEPGHAATGTRMKTSVKRSTINEGNRFYYETFAKNEDGRKLLLAIQTSLEQVPSEAPLKYFNRDEQLAYWLNLYNVTVLNQIIEEYPQRSLKKLAVGRKSIFSKKILTVAGIPLSLDDIEFTILKNNYDSNPLIIYGLYQGYIGGPNIRKRAYTGGDVWRALKNNAHEFINSNRGTYPKDEKTFRVSSLYERNEAFFPNFDDDLTEHLMTYIEGEERSELQASRFLRADIDDWTVTDLGGTYRDFGGAFADNNAALLDAVKSTVPGDNGGVMATAAGAGSTMLAASGKPLQRFDPELLTHLNIINDKREFTNLKNGTVTVEELGVAPTETGADNETGKKDNDEKDNE
jgi:hypothetical protein